MQCVFKMFINLIFLADSYLNGYCLQEREFKEALEAYNEKNKEKAMYVSKLVEVKHSVSFCLFFLKGSLFS